MNNKSIVDQVKDVLKATPQNDLFRERESSLQKLVDQYNNLVEKGWAIRRGNNLLSISDMDKIKPVQLQNSQPNTCFDK
jgi:hypothetical protein